MAQPNRLLRRASDSRGFWKGYTVNIHPLLKIDLDKYEVTNFMATVEIKNKSTGKWAGIPKPYDPQADSWWAEMAAKAILEIN